MVFTLALISLATLLSLAAVHAPETRRAVIILALHSAVIGLSEAAYCYVERGTAELPYAVSSLLVSSMAVPALLLRTAGAASLRERVPGWATAVSLALLCLYAYVALYPPPELGKMALHMVSAAIPLLMVASSRDPVRVLIGINMASSSLHPLLTEAPALFSFLSSTSMLLANAVGVLVISSAYREYGTLIIERWAKWRS
ncbi:MAG: hypothetical protein DRK00_02610 [Thermoprotei archaeon]|nr:MAG: hypothetical protein DRK00_02610 [Thermoprotei archaeon]